jgi:cytochrome c nitrite reductase small subunit
MLIISFVVLLGIFLGLGIFTFHYGEGMSYFSGDPKSCVNCHIMQPQYDSWKNSSHHAVANCVQCHLPHGGINKYIAKAENGFLHSKAFTFQNFHEPIFIRKRNKEILHNNCLQCHSDLVHEISMPQEGSIEPINCLHCHKGVGHGESIGMGRYEPTSAVKLGLEK